MFDFQKKRGRWEEKKPTETDWMNEESEKMSNKRFFPPFFSFSKTIVEVQNAYNSL